MPVDGPQYPVNLVLRGRSVLVVGGGPVATSKVEGLLDGGADQILVVAPDVTDDLRALADDGVWMIVEPMAGDRVEDNLTPVGRAYYGFSTLLCTPASLSQEVGLALGTQAGPARIRAVVEQGGFRSLRSAAETPFHRVMEVRVAV